MLHCSISPFVRLVSYAQTKLSCHPGQYWAPPCFDNPNYWNLWLFLRGKRGMWSIWKHSAINCISYGVRKRFFLMLFELSSVGESLFLLNFTSIKFKTGWKSPLYIKYLNNMPCVMDAPLNLDGIKFPSSVHHLHTVHCAMFGRLGYNLT